MLESLRLSCKHLPLASYHHTIMISCLHGNLHVNRSKLSSKSLKSFFLGAGEVLKLFFWSRLTWESSCQKYKSVFSHLTWESTCQKSFDFPPARQRWSFDMGILMSKIHDRVFPVDMGIHMSKIICKSFPQPF